MVVSVPVTAGRVSGVIRSRIGCVPIARRSTRKTIELQCRVLRLQTGMMYRTPIGPDVSSR
jgi:hypothetical protein